jgi:hypothetical protein
MRVKAPGATPGRVGRCPRCGGRLQVPDWPVPPGELVPQREQAARDEGYLIDPGESFPAGESLAEPARAASVARPTYAERTSQGAPSDGVLPPLMHVEPNWLASFDYPLRGAECLGVLGALSIVFWVFGTLVPEYCLTLMGDADEMGTPTLGKFIALISFLPVVFLAPFAVVYWLQYLGRVLVASAIGETRPPRSPDRNFDGLFNGLSPWLIWLCLGVSVGLSPLLFYVCSLTSAADVRWWIVAGLGLLALPYILLALMLSFLHDDALAAKPWGVLAAFLRVTGTFGLLTLFVAAALGLVVGAFGVALLLRAHFFWLYLALCLGSWVVTVWVSIVVMRVLGTYYHRHSDALRWHRASLRWGVAWRM